MSVDTERPIPEYPTTNEGFWFTMCVVFALVAFVGTIFAAVFVISADGQSAAALRARTISPFLIASGAFVTFCTIAWRGAITTRQVDSDAERGLAELLEKGVERLAPEGGIEKMSLGLSLLETVALAPSKKYAQYSLEQIAHALIEIVKLEPEAQVRRTLHQAKGIFERANRINRKIGAGATFSLPSYTVRNRLVKPQRHSLQIYYGMPEGGYSFCRFEVPKGAWDAISSAGPSLDFTACTFEDLNGGSWLKPVDLDLTFRLRGNSFVRMHFERVSVPNGVMYEDNVASFIECDFSGTTFVGRQSITRCNFELCRYQEGFEPRLVIDGHRVNFKDATQALGIVFYEYGDDDVDTLD